MEEHQLLSIRERREGDWMHLFVAGELDISTAPTLRERIRQAREAGAHLRIDLSGLEFIDSGGVHVLLDAIRDPRADDWQVKIEPRPNGQARRYLDLLRVANRDLEI